MAKKCGNTPGDGFGNLGDWIVYYTVPVPSKVRFKYPGEGWQEIEADRYTNETSSGGQEVGILYQVTTMANYTFRRGNDVQNTTITYRFRNIPGKIGGIFSMRPGYTFGGNNNPPVAYLYAGGQNPSFEGNYSATWETIDNGVYWLIYSNNVCNSHVITSIQREDGQPDNSGRCKFRLFDCNDTLLYEREEGVCPQAQAIPCHYRPEDEQSITIPLLQRAPFLINATLRVSNYVNDGGRKCTEVSIFRYGAIPPFDETTVLDICSPECCGIYPKVCYDVEPGPKDDCEKCPTGTAIECQSGDQICCYDGSGKVIRIIPVCK